MILHLTLVIFALSAPLYASTQDRIEEVLGYFSDTEKQKLALFFEEAIVHDSFGYTIFGKKPVSFVGFFALPQYAGPSWIIRDHIALHEGARACVKLNLFIADSNFAFKFHHDPKYQQTFLYLINKKEFLHIVQTHLNLFKEILGAAITPQLLLENILRADSTIEEILQDSEGLKGIIFGFGAKNSFMFQQREFLQKKIQALYAPPLRFNFDHIKNGSVPLSAEIAGMVKEYTYLQKSLRKTPKTPRNYLTTFSLPGFVGDFEDPETQALIEHYRAVRKILNNEYAHGNFLKVTLCAML